LAYFATAAGIPTRLEFERASYGPFAVDLKKVQTTMINNGLIVEERRGQMFEISIAAGVSAAAGHGTEEADGPAALTPRQGPNLIGIGHDDRPQIDLRVQGFRVGRTIPTAPSPSSVLWRRASMGVTTLR